MKNIIFWLFGMVALNVNAVEPNTEITVTLEDNEYVCEIAFPDGCVVKDNCWDIIPDTKKNLTINSNLGLIHSKFCGDGI